jgi:hypothetical protein
MAGLHSRVRLLNPDPAPKFGTPSLKTRARVGFKDAEDSFASFGPSSAPYYPLEEVELCKKVILARVPNIAYCGLDRLR